MEKNVMLFGSWHLPFFSLSFSLFSSSEALNVYDKSIGCWNLCVYDSCYYIIMLTWSRLARWRQTATAQFNDMFERDKRTLRNDKNSKRSHVNELSISDMSLNEREGDEIAEYDDQVSKNFTFNIQRTIDKRRRWYLVAHLSRIVWLFFYP
jgi:hypothetical protein